jgi:hypothetical protein
VPTKQRFTVTTDCQYASVPEALAECRDAGLLRAGSPSAARSTLRYADSRLPRAAVRGHEQPNEIAALTGL